MFPILFLVFVVAIKVFKKTTPNGKYAQFYSETSSKFYLFSLTSRT